MIGFLVGVVVGLLIAFLRMIGFLVGVVVGLLIAFLSLKVGEPLGRSDDWRCRFGSHDWRAVGEPNLAIGNHWMECRRCGRVEVDGP